MKFFRESCHYCRQRMPCLLLFSPMDGVNEIEDDHLNAWILYALGQDVKNLKLGIFELGGVEDYDIPGGIFQSENLVKLKISSTNFHIIPLEGLVVHLPNLKSLYLWSRGGCWS
ncbi:PREDICTED: uncharacterized protein LOC104712238 [Camelina sativa]|uniref:Uncharacterized protein LOC104712238 n=1 Tax=Camelina sativa TaxID=90675 RepID=A0ABM1QGL7_CAMSA|nr:PREDICTED: uncharacterized protein LOC104712238 [Camelina sativa]